jgi:metal iron transporter
MPHSLYLGSGIVQPRLIEYDEKNGHRIPASLAKQTSHPTEEKPFYQPSLAAINHCMKYSIIELAISLSTFALFVNSAILIVAGASLYGNGIEDAQDPSLFSIYDLLVSSIGPAAGTLFVLALLLSGMSAGIVCTIAGQMVSEGALNWTISPWLRRLITRSIAITPSIIIASAVGKEGLDAALNGSQVALSVALPFISAPLIYFTARNKYMIVNNNRKAAIAEDNVNDGELERLLGAEQPVDEGTKMRNHWAVTAFAVLLWLVVAVMSVANLVILGLDH